MDSSNSQHSSSSSDTDSDSGSTHSFGSEHRHHHPGSTPLPHTPGSWFTYESESPHHHHHPGSASHPTPESDSGPPPGFDQGFPVENNPPAEPQPPHGAGNSSRKRKATSATSPREKENDSDTSDNSTLRRRRHAAKAYIRRRRYNRMMKTATPGRKQEINLLNDMIMFRNKYGRYPYNSRYDMRQFYKYWTKRRAMFAERKILNNKMVDLHERFVSNYQKTLSGDDVEYFMDPTEVRVYRLSYRIWGEKDDDQDQSSERTISDESIDSERTNSDSSSTDSS